MKTLTGGQKWVLAAATLPMIGAGAAGAWGTYTNITAVFHREGTAIGVVAAGEGATLVLALVLVGLTLLGQSSPTAVRIGLWLLPASASVTGLIVAPSAKDAAVFAITPMAMTVSAEGLGLLARRIVVYSTGVDAEAQRRNAAVLRRIAYHQARAERHPWQKSRAFSQLVAWRLLRQVGAGDQQLGAHLVDVQRTRITGGADGALAGMYGAPRDQPALPAPEQPNIVRAEREHDLGEQPVSVANSDANTVRDGIANKATTSTNPTNTQPIMAELVREHVANTTDNRDAVNAVMAALPEANRQSVSAAVRRERRNTQGYA